MSSPSWHLTGRPMSAGSSSMLMVATALAAAVSSNFGFTKSETPRWSSHGQREGSLMGKAKGNACVRRRFRHSCSPG